MEGESKKNFFNFAAIGIFFGVLLLIVSFIWVAMVFISDDEASGEDVTWVG